jgi:ribosome-associated translation inhibitor RaiA
MDTQTTPASVEVSSSGRVTRQDRAHARDKIARALRVAPRPVLRATARLWVDANPSLERPAIVKVRADMGGRVVRSHVAATNMRDAIDLAEHRLRRQLADLAAADRDRVRTSAVPPPGEWRHGDLPAVRPEYYPRPPEERRVVRHKTPTSAPMSAEQAALEMTLLDYDFLLFAAAGGGGDSVVYRTANMSSHLRVIPPSGDGGAPAGSIPADPPPAVMDVKDALQLLDLSGEPFVFFVDADSRRGAIAYRRYDGHYGLIRPADEA